MSLGWIAWALLMPLQARAGRVEAFSALAAKSHSACLGLWNDQQLTTGIDYCWNRVQQDTAAIGRMSAESVFARWKTPEWLAWLAYAVGPPMLVYGGAVALSAALRYFIEGFKVPA